MLLTAIKETNKIGIAKISIRSKSSLAAVRVIDNCLSLETMFFPDEIRAISQVPNLPSKIEVNEKELGMAKMLVEQLSEPFDPQKYSDDYRSALTELIQSKIVGQSPDIIEAPSVEGKSNVIDLMTALQESLLATKKNTTPAASKNKRRKNTKGNVS
ncbi:hypothetical protein ASF12_22215 [Paenibacillus sp. Leaf72]|nr:hypothetical protein ASF12_22215 [Paenibacillus sp. Leaf72]